MFLIDFGLTTKYMDNNGRHLEKVKGTTFCGNISFASLNKCQLYTTSRKDDFEPVFYVLIYLLSHFMLPYDSVIEVPREMNSK